MTMGQPVAMGGSGGASAPAMTTPPPPPASSQAGSTATGAGGTIAAGSGGKGGSAGSVAPVDAGTRPEPDAGMADAGAPDAGSALAIADGLDELFLHDACTGEYAQQPDTCLHMQKVEKDITLGGNAGTMYEVTVRVRGLFEPTTINGGMAPDRDHPYFKVGGTVSATDYSQWHIKVSNPAQTYWLNHYPTTSHTIYKEDFEATITVAGGAKVTVGATDGNDREIDNAEMGIADRRQLIDGVTDMVMDGQLIRLDVIKVEEK